MDIKLKFDEKLLGNYKSAFQKVRVLTEKWVNDSVFCPNCGCHKINKYPDNQPAGDFYCSNCHEDYELKSKRDRFGNKILNGAYHSLLMRITSSNNPNFFLLNYDLANFEVINFLVIPKHFFIPKIIEKRRPLSSSARRAGWIGCNILIKKIFQKQEKYFLFEINKLSQKKKCLQIGKRLYFYEKKKKLR